MNKLVLIFTTFLFNSAWATDQLCQNPILLDHPNIGVETVVSVDLNMNTVSLHATIETGRGLVQTGNYILNQDIKSSVFDSDCNQGAFFTVRTFDETHDREYQRTKVVLDLVCAQDSLGQFSIYQNYGYCKHTLD